MKKEELFIKYREKYNFQNERLLEPIRKLLMTAEGTMLIAGIEEFFADNLDFRTKEKTKL